MTESTDDVKGCARCGGDHDALAFERIDWPIRVGTKVFTAWAACPTNGQPILRVVER